MSQAEVLTSKIPEWKKEEIEEFKQLIDEYDAVGVVNVEGIASKQFQEVRKNLHGSAKVRVGRNTLMRRALTDNGMDELAEHVKGQTGLIFTNDNPFSLYTKIEEGKSPAPIKAGQVAPHDIVVPEGDTGFDPGPFVGDLQQAGVQAQIQEGGIKVTADSVVVEEGEEATQQVSEILQKLEIYPIEVGLDLRALQEGDTIFEPDMLDIDVEEYRADLKSAVSGAHNLAINAGVVNDQTVKTLIAKADSEARALGIEAEVFEAEVIDRLVSNAYAGIQALAAELDDEVLPEELQGVEAEQEVEETEGDEEEEAEEAEEAEEDAPEEEGDGEEDEEVSEGMGNLF